MIFLALYTISDLHLSFGADKPMDIFRGWENYTDRIIANWNRIITDEDTVVLPGDFSWGLKIDETLNDFKFLNSLNGRKIIGKGNHDLCWGTKKKIEEFFNENDIKNVDILFNNAFLVDGISVCGSRGWFFDSNESDNKVIKREAARLETSIKEGIALGGEPVVFIHYPPVYADMVCNEIFDVIKKYDVKRVYHGHIHGAGFNKAISHYDGVDFKLVSCDCVDFTPIYVKK